MRLAGCGASDRAVVPWLQQICSRSSFAAARLNSWGPRQSKHAHLNRPRRSSTPPIGSSGRRLTLTAPVAECQRTYRLSWQPGGSAAAAPSRAARRHRCRGGRQQSPCIWWAVPSSRKQGDGPSGSATWGHHTAGAGSFRPAPLDRAWHGCQPSRPAPAHLVHQRRPRRRAALGVGAALQPPLALPRAGAAAGAVRLGAPQRLHAGRAAGAGGARGGLRLTRGAQRGRRLQSCSPGSDCPRAHTGLRGEAAAQAERLAAALLADGRAAKPQARGGEPGRAAGRRAASKRRGALPAKFEPLPAAAARREARVGLCPALREPCTLEAGPMRPRARWPACSSGPRPARRSPLPGKATQPSLAVLVFAEFPNC